MLFGEGTEADMEPAWLSSPGSERSVLLPVKVCENQPESRDGISDTLDELDE